MYRYSCLFRKSRHLDLWRRSTCLEAPVDRLEHTFSPCRLFDGGADAVYYSSSASGKRSRQTPYPVNSAALFGCEMAVTPSIGHAPRKHNITDPSSVPTRFNAVLPSNPLTSTAPTLSAHLLLWCRFHFDCLMLLRPSRSLPKPIAHPPYQQ